MSTVGVVASLRPRIFHAGALGLTIIVGLAVRSGCPSLSHWWAQHLGVALWAMAAYWMTRVIAPRLKIRSSAALALIISWAVELLQVTPISRSISAIHPVLRLCFGEVFDPADLASLAAGVLAAAAIHAVAANRSRSVRCFTKS